MRFEIPKECCEKLNKWLDEQRPKTGYCGAIGGATTYSFTPTSLGVVIKVKNCMTDEEIDLSDYENW